MNKKLIINNSSFTRLLMLSASADGGQVIRKSGGFTLIELLVAIAIIGILSSFLLANFVGVRQRARDGVRKSDLRQIQSALELYRADQDSYPLTLDNCGGSIDDGGDPPVTYMTKIPCDPSGGDAVYTYSFNDPGYTLIACLENSNDSQRDPTPNLNCASPKTGISHTVTNP